MIFHKKPLLIFLRIKIPLEKEELLDETKRLIKEHIMEQIRQNQIELKKHRL